MGQLNLAGSGRAQEGKLEKGKLSLIHILRLMIVY